MCIYSSYAERLGKSTHICHTLAVFQPFVFLSFSIFFCQTGLFSDVSVKEKAPL